MCVNSDAIPVYVRQKSPQYELHKKGTIQWVYTVINYLESLTFLRQIQEKLIVNWTSTSHKRFYNNAQLKEVGQEIQIV